MRIDRLEPVGPLAGGATPPRTGADLHTRDFAASLDALLSTAGDDASTEAPTDEAEVGGIRFSRHALARWDARGIALDPAEMAALEGAVDPLAAALGTVFTTIDSTYVAADATRPHPLEESP